MFKFLIVGKTGIGKTNFLLNILHLNPIWDKIYIYTNNIDDKYQFLLDRFPKHIKLYLNKIDFSEINEKYQNLSIFDDLVFSNKKYQHFFSMLKIKYKLLFYITSIFFIR